MKSPFVQPEKSRVANVTIAKSRVLAAQVLRTLRNKSDDLITTLSFGPDRWQTSESHRRVLPSAVGLPAKGLACRVAARSRVLRDECEFVPLRLFRLPLRPGDADEVR